MPRFNMNDEFTGFDTELGRKIIRACQERGEEAVEYARKVVKKWDESDAHIVITNHDAWKLLSRIERAYPKTQPPKIDAGKTTPESLFSFD